MDDNHQQMLDDIAKQNVTIACLRENLAAMRRERGEMDKNIVHILVRLREMMPLLTNVGFVNAQLRIIIRVINRIDSRGHAHLPAQLVKGGGKHGRKVLPKSSEKHGTARNERRSSSSITRPRRRTHSRKQAQGRRRKS